MASPAEPAPPAADQPARARRGLAGRLLPRLVVLIAAAVASAVAAWLGAWWVPFLLGVATGILRAAWPARSRGSVLSAVVGAIAGWLIPVWVQALRGQPVGATARVIAGLAGLPPYAGVTVVVVALLAALQVLVGAWLARAVTPRRADRPAVAEDART